MRKDVYDAFIDEFQKLASEDNLVKEAILDTALAAYLGHRKFEDAGLDPGEGALRGGAGWTGGGALGGTIGALSGGLGGAGIGALAGGLPGAQIGSGIGSLLGATGGGLLGGYKGYKYLTEKAEESEKKKKGHKLCCL